MKRRTHLIAYTVLIAVTFALTIAALFFLPDTIPAHYGINGSVDRYGSKFELLILPAASLITGTILWVCSKFASRKESSSKNNERITLIIGEVTLAMFMALQIYLICLAASNAQNIYAMKIDIGSLILFLMGAFMIIIGNIMPKAKKNALMGFRMSWTMKSEEIWKRCQRFAGFASVAAGIVMIVCGFVFNGIAAFAAMLIIVAVMSVIDSVYAYRVSH